MKKLLRFILFLLILFFGIFIGLFAWNFFHQGKSQQSSDRKEEMHIVFGIDDYYKDIINVVVTSLLENNPDSLVHLHILGCRISSAHQEKIRKLVSLFPNARVDFYEATAPEGLKKLIARKSISTATFFRFLPIKLFPPSIHKILYLDGDTLILRSLDSFYNTTLGNSFLMAVADSPYDINSIKRLSAYHLTRYINAGVLLLNLQEIRKSITWENLRSYISNINDTQITYADQDIINILWQDKMLLADERYNANARLPHGKEPIILHYSGEKKPWHKNRKTSFIFRIQSIPWHIYHKKYQNYLNGYSPLVQSYYQSLLDIYHIVVPTGFTVMNWYNTHINNRVIGFISNFVY